MRNYISGNLRINSELMRTARLSCIVRERHERGAGVQEYYIIELREDLPKNPAVKSTNFFKKGVQEY